MNLESFSHALQYFLLLNAHVCVLGLWRCLPRPLRLRICFQNGRNDCTEHHSRLYPSGSEEFPSYCRFHSEFLCSLKNFGTKILFEAPTLRPEVAGFTRIEKLLVFTCRIHAYSRQSSLRHGLVDAAVDSPIFIPIVQIKSTGNDDMRSKASLIISCHVHLCMLAPWPYMNISKTVTVPNKQRVQNILEQPDTLAESEFLWDADGWWVSHFDVLRMIHLPCVGQGLNSLERSAHAPVHNATSGSTLSASQHPSFWWQFLNNTLRFLAFQDTLGLVHRTYACSQNGQRSRRRPKGVVLCCSKQIPGQQESSLRRQAGI